MRRFEEKLAEEFKVNPKSFWHYATQKCSSRCKIPGILHDSKSVADPELKVEIFNQYFSSVFFLSNPSIVHPKPPLYDISHNMEPILITDTSVLNELISLKLNKSGGPDSIHPDILQKCNTVLCQPLSLVFKLSANLSKLPQDCKTAHIILIFKNGRKHLAENY
jgi:hypothetical protein